MVAKKGVDVTSQVYEILNVNSGRHIACLTSPTVGLSVMNKLFKILGVIGLTFAISYTGVAWAFFECLNHGDETVRTRELEGTLISESTRQDFDIIPCGPSRSKLHCPPIFHEFDAVAQASSTTSLTQVRKAIELKTSFHVGTLNALKAIETAWRSYPPDWKIASSPSEIPSNYLLFSVFLI